MSKYSDNIADNGKSYAHLLPGLRVGGQRGICTACAEGFSSNTGFDRHQSVKKIKNADGVDDVILVCKHPSKLGLVQDETGYWQTPRPG